MIDWAALAEPQADGSDAAMVRKHMHAKLPREPFTLQVRQRALDFEPKNKPFLSADPDGIPAGANALLQAWPAAWRAAEELLVAIYPCHDPRYRRDGVVGGSYGCKSDDLADFGHVYASTTSVAAFVEGIVSSLANWKLYAAGIAHERWEARLLDLPVVRSHASPLRPAETAAPGSVIHICYCMAHILVYYRSLLTLTPVPPGATYQIRQAHERLVRGRPMLEAMLPHAHDGFELFLSRFLSWIDRLIARPPEV